MVRHPLRPTSRKTGPQRGLPVLCQDGGGGRSTEGPPSAGEVIVSDRMPIHPEVVDCSGHVDRFPDDHGIGQQTQTARAIRLPPGANLDLVEERQVDNEMRTR